MIALRMLAALITLVCLTSTLEAAEAMNDKTVPLDIAVAGDLLGHLIGTVSTQSGSVATVDADVSVAGSTALGKWHATAKTGANGYFEVDLPLGLTGKIDISASKDGSSGAITIASGDICQRLTPRPTQRSRRISLEGKWDFIVDPPKDFLGASIDWAKITVPAHWEMEGFISATGNALYRKNFDIPANWGGKRIKFRSDGVYSACEIWLNGERVGSHEGGGIPFEVDLTDAAKPGSPNTLLVLVTARSNASKLDRSSFFAYFELAGIWHPVEVFCVEPAHISRLAIDTDFDKNYKNADLRVSVDVSNEQLTAANAQVAVRVYDSSGSEIKLAGLSTQTSVKPWDATKLTLKANVPDLRKWSAEDPNLYKLVAELKVGKTSQVVEQTFGFREIEIKGRSFLLNGQPIKILGTNHLDAHPLKGRAVGEDLVRQDLELMKRGNYNALRATILPPHPSLPGIADRLGLYVEYEGPFCWAGQNWFGEQLDDANDLRYAPYAIAATSAYIERDRNSPSVLIWSICNESGFGRIFQLAHEFAKKTDPTRPNSAGQSTTLDIATQHNPTSMQRIKGTENATTPVLFDEAIAAFHGWGTLAQSLEVDPGLRDYMITGFFEPMEAIRKGEQYMGVQQWAWVDDQFLVPGREIGYQRRIAPPIHYADSVYKMPGRGIVGDFVWGVIDGWRRPRPEYWLTKKLYSPVVIEEKPLPLPKPGAPVSVPVENRNYFVNLNVYKCVWSLGNEHGEIKAGIAPQTSGAISIPIKRALSPDDRLTLEFFDADGRLVDGYHLAFRQRVVPQLPWSAKPARTVSEQGTARYLNWAFLERLIGNDRELAYERTTGTIMRVVAGKDLVLMGGPDLHITKNAAPAERHPTGWQIASAVTSSDANAGVLTVKGRYAEGFEGGYVIRMDDAGDMEISYSFKYSGPDFNTREIGLSFELPLSYDHLEWDRRAEWSYYPDDHIGRPHGKAVAHPTVPQIVPPTNRPYALDDHPYGSNDFRSTKRNVYTAKLTDDRGHGIEVFGGKTQHVRVTVGIHSISLKVLDVMEGSATGINEYDGIYGQGRAVKSGDTLSGVVKLRLLGNSK